MTSFKTLIGQGVQYPKRFVEGRLQKSTMAQTDLKPGDGAIVDIDGKQVAVYQKSEKEQITLSPVCTHLGCIVGWNKSDKTWDCPCHGSRYEADGTVKRGPAKKNLNKVTV